MSDPVRLLGALADDHRRRVVAALILGATSVDEVRGMALLSATAVANAVRRLREDGLLLGHDGDALALAEDAFAHAARRAAELARSAAPDPYRHEPPEAARTLRAFVRDGRLTALPAARGKRLIVLRWLADRFPPGVDYPEREVNRIIGQVHPDHATLRRLLVDEGLMHRQAGVYRRADAGLESGP